MYIPLIVLVLIIFLSAGIGFEVAILMTTVGRRSLEESWTRLFAEQAELQNRKIKMMREQSK